MLLIKKILKSMIADNKKIYPKIFSFILMLLCLHDQTASCQGIIIDKIVAVVGDKPILLSEIEQQAISIQNQTEKIDSNLRCMILENIMIEKLLLNQAEKDSISITDEQVDAELNKKIRYFVSQMGSVEKLEAYLGKSLIQIKSDFRDRIKQQLISEEMQRKISGNISVSPSEVKAYFNNIPKDSIPFIESEIQFAHITKKPPVNEIERNRVREELESIRKKILDGKSFGSMAGIYSEDPISAARGGELGFFNRGEMVPEFEATAFSLKGKEISEIVETPFGFHIIQLIERRGESINVRHILISPKPNSLDLNKARYTLDSIASEIRKGKISFDEAAIKYSDDAETRNNGGIMINPGSGSTWFPISQLEQNTFFIIDKLKTGEISDPVIMRTGEKKEAYQIIKVIARTDAHIANLDTDYQIIRSAAEQQKRNKVIQDWIHRKRNFFFINIDDDFKNCTFENNWKNQ